MAHSNNTSKDIDYICAVISGNYSKTIGWGKHKRIFSHRFCPSVPNILPCASAGMDVVEDFLELGRQVTWQQHRLFAEPWNSVPFHLRCAPKKHNQPRLA